MTVHSFKTNEQQEKAGSCRFKSQVWKISISLPVNSTFILEFCPKFKFKICGVGGVTSGTVPPCLCQQGQEVNMGSSRVKGNKVGKKMLSLIYCYYKTTGVPLTPASPPHTHTHSVASETVAVCCMSWKGHDSTDTVSSALPGSPPKGGHYRHYSRWCPVRPGGVRTLEPNYSSSNNNNDNNNLLFFCSSVLFTSCWTFTKYRGRRVKPWFPVEQTDRTGEKRRLSITGVKLI